MLLLRGNPSVRSMQPSNNGPSLAASLVRGPLYPSQSGINISLHAEAGEKAYSKFERRVCPNGSRIDVVHCKQSDTSGGLLLVSARDQLEVPRPVENLPERKPVGAKKEAPMELYTSLALSSASWYPKDHARGFY